MYVHVEWIKKSVTSKATWTVKLNSCTHMHTFDGVLVLP